MGSRAHNRNNVLAGSFLVSAIILAVFLSFWVEDGFDKLPFVNPKSTYVARFTIAEGIAGIKHGSPVTIGGKTVGSVHSVEYAYSDGEGGSELIGIDVGLEIESEMTLYPDASVIIVSPLLGTMSSINIADVGGSAGGDVLAVGGMLDGQPPLRLAEWAGFGDISRNADAVLVKADAILDEITPAVGPAIEDIESVLADASGFSSMLRENRDLWSGKVDDILDHTDELLIDTVPSVASELGAGIADGRRLIGSAQGMMDENRADVRRAVTNLEGITTRVRYDLLGRMERVLDEGVIAAANLSDVGGRAIGLFDRIEPPLVRTMANLQLTSSQSTLLLEEVRAAPWRLLNGPDEKEQREIVLFSAVRRYAESVEQLRNASDAMDSVLRGARAGGRELQPEQVLQMNNEIKDSFQRLQDAEQALLGLIERETGD